MNRRLVSLAFVLATLGTGAIARAEDPTPTGPSFDCAKASTDLERLICDAPALAWWDRQMAGAYELAQLAADEKGRETLLTAQRLFLASRDKCALDYACLVDSYAARIVELAPSDDPGVVRVGRYTMVPADGMSGDLDLVALGDGMASISMETVSANAHTCALLTDDGRDSPTGIITFENEIAEGELCTVTITPDGANMVVTSESCLYYCGAAAQLDGTYSPRAN